MKYVGIIMNKHYRMTSFYLNKECEQDIKQVGDTQFRRESVCWTDDDSWQIPNAPLLGAKIRILSEYPGITRDELDRRRTARGWQFPKT